MNAPLSDRYTLAYRAYPYARVPDQDRPAPVRHLVVIVGGGPVGMTLALDLGLKGVRVLVLDDHEGIGMGSRAICFAKRPLEILDRLGCGDPVVQKGVVWNLGKVFHRDQKIFEFNLLPEEGHKYPAFINLQQPYFEKAVLDHIRALQPQGLPVEIRGRNRVDAVEDRGDHVALTVMTPDGPYTVEADWLVACDGAGSPVRGMLGLGFEGAVFKDSFLIADVRMKADFPTERWFWFDPPSGSGASQLLHKQPDDVWRIDFQIGWDVDREEELKEANVRRRVARMIGEDVAFDLVWSSIYTFQCRRMTRFHDGRVIFAGDSAHQVSPFGARGANSGLQDADNLAWKLALILDEKAGPRLLDSYDTERIHGANENILNSTRSTDFISPKSDISRVFRDAVLHLAQNHDFARPFVNSGRLSVPCTYDGSPLNTPDALPGGPAHTRPGSPCPDAPVDGGYLLNRLGDATGARFQILALDTDAPAQFAAHGIDCRVLHLNIGKNALLRERYLGKAASAVYLIRPDQHVAARWPQWDENAVAAAIARAIGREV
ncbi:MAG: 3-(3-hydroxy-phenyl)propionate hydroxylase [Rhodobacteraceae bacterium HLUCCA12]|nr:MAG: 3-(3-hydroxy-phenyl)propionate hydroxylase [Rhodobacteraceae bacterium HLUCCA12]